jgi:hypothetical protein
MPIGSRLDAARTTVRGRLFISGGSGGRTSALLVTGPRPAAVTTETRSPSTCAASAELRAVGAADAAGPCGSGTSGPPDKKLKIAMPPTNTITVLYGKRRLRVVGASLIPVAR